MSAWRSLIITWEVKLYKRESEFDYNLKANR